MAKTIPFVVNNIEHAELLRKALVKFLQAGETIHLDFAEAGIVPASFMNVAVASLLVEFSPDTLNKQLVFLGMKSHHKYALAQAIKFQKEMVARD